MLFCNTWACFLIFGCYFVIYRCCFVICGRLFCNMWVCVCVAFVMCWCFDNCVGVLVVCVLVFSMFYCFVYEYLFLIVTSVRTAATE